MLCINLHIRVLKFSPPQLAWDKRLCYCCCCCINLKFKIKWMNDTYSTSLSLCSGGVLKSEKLIMLCIYIQEIDCCRVFSFTTFCWGHQLRIAPPNIQPSHCLTSKNIDFPISNIQLNHCLTVAAPNIQLDSFPVATFELLSLCDFFDMACA